jgi:hypothetical protein
MGGVRPDPDHPALVGASGLVLAVVLLGPALGPGSLLNLDLVATDHWPAPRSFWGLGPELARAVPLEMALAGAAALTSGATAVKAFFVVAITVAFWAAHRLARQLGLGPGAAWSAAALYAANPWLLTRVAVGHLTMVGAYALLPLVHRRLLAPSADGRRTFLAGALLATMGFYGGLLAGLCVLGGLLTEQQRRPVAALGVLVASQLPWLVPGAIQTVEAPELGDAANFPSGLAHWSAPARLLTGHGFWQRPFQVGGEPASLLVVLGAVLLALVAAGWHGLPRSWSRPAGTVAAAAAALALVDAVPGLQRGYEQVTSMPGLAAVREPQRLVALTLVVVAPAAAAGAADLARRVARPTARAVRLVPLAVAAILATPGGWGLDGQVDPVDLPPEWAAARAITRAEPGTVLVLPWYRYLDIATSDGPRRVLNPALAEFGPDVIVSPDLGLAEPTRETIDPRAATIELLLPAIVTNEPTADRLGALGVRWVLLLQEADHERYTPEEDPGLRTALAGDALELYEVTAWRDDGVDLATPLVGAGPDGATRWHAPAAHGWLQNLSSAGRTGTGLVSLPGGGGVVWYWPGALAALTTALWVVTTILLGTGYRWVPPGQPTRG